MQAISLEKCTLHPDREAVARCLECQRYFCRECITEHEGRVMCSQCLSHLAASEKDSRFDFSGLKAHYAALKRVFLVALQVAIGIFISWGFFYYIGQYVIEIPSSFHEGTVWQSPDEASHEK